MSRAFLEAHGIGRQELAAALRITVSAINHKLAGRRGWAKHEIDATLAFFSARAGRPVSYEEVFSTPASTGRHTDVGPDLADATENAEPQGRGRRGRADAASIGAEEAPTAGQPTADEEHASPERAGREPSAGRVSPVEGASFNRRRSHDRRTGTEG